jgi:antitoxin (DNA-binding transcriptional repressor) of toxin-antitoxin stability system
MQELCRMGLGDRFAARSTDCLEWTSKSSGRRGPPARLGKALYSTSKSFKRLSVDVQRRTLMLSSISIEEAQATLPEIIGNLGPGEAVVITKDDQPVAELRALMAGKPQPCFGGCKDMLTIVAEDEDHLEDFKEYMSWTPNNSTTP